MGDSDNLDVDVGQITFDQVNNAVLSLHKLFLDFENRNKTELFDSVEPVFLQINFCVIPKAIKHIIRFRLPHSLVTDTSEVCLLVPDVIRGRNVDHQRTIDHYETLLRKKNVDGVTKIIPSRQVRVEYSQYEEKRKLCNMFDVFLIDHTISSFLIPKLGKQFQKSRKWPIPINMKSKYLKNEIASKLKKTSMSLDNHGKTKVVQVGHTGMSSLAIVENVLAVCSKFEECFKPWGWKNIRSLLIKGIKSAQIPFYVSLHVIQDFPMEDTTGKPRNDELVLDRNVLYM